MAEDTERTASWQPGEGPRPGEVWQRVPQPGEVVAGRFRLVRVLGAGGSGVVFEAEDLQLRQRVAVKVIHPFLSEARSQERLRREVRAARGHHEHVVPVYDLHEDGGLRFLSMELVSGASLKAVLEDRKRLAVAEAIVLGRQMASALAFFHGRGLVHRDVKPSNILLTEGEKGAEDGRPWMAKLCDMGLVRSLEAGLTVTETAMVVGTPAYMAPEQATGSTLTAASDVYALGLVLWECLTGDTPLRGDTAVATLIKRQSSRPPRLRAERPEAPAWLGRLLTAMLDPHPRRRPSAAQVERALSAGWTGWRPPWRRLGAAAVVALAAGASLAGWRVMARGATVRVEAAGLEVAGYDRHGRVTWRRPLENPVQQVMRFDLDGDGGEEVLVSAFPAGQDEARGGPLPMSEFLIVTRTGAVVTSIRPEQLVREWAYPFPLHLKVGISSADLDGDGVSEVLLNAAQRWFYPNPVLLYWPHYGVWDVLLIHSGRLVDLEPVPGRPGQIAFVGVNNPLGVMPVFGVVSILPPGQRRDSALPRPLASPDQAVTPVTNARWLVYVPLGGELWRAGRDGDTSVMAAADGVFKVSFNGGSVRVDARGNPEGPNWGQDLLDKRLDFMLQVGNLSRGDGVGSPALVEGELARLEADMAPLLAEPPYRATLALAAARAFARTGAAARARGVLLAEVSNEDVAFRLANLEALDGRFAEATARTWRLVAGGHSARAGFDAARLLLDLAVESRDGEELERVIFAWARFAPAAHEASSRVAPALWALARLWWDEATAADGQVRTSPLADDGDAVACLVRWRLKRATAADAVAMEEYIRGGFEGAPLGRAAQAAVLLATGASGEALHLLDRVVNEMQPEADFDLRSRRYLHLARALRAHALAGVGRSEQARSEATRLLATSRPDLLPAIVARELLEELPRQEEGAR